MVSQGNSGGGDDGNQWNADAARLNKAVSEGNFNELQRMMAECNNIGGDIIILMGMCVLLHTQVKALREEVSKLKGKSSL